MRGRVIALWAVAFLGSTPIGGPIAGAVAQHLGPRWVLVLGALACFVAALIGAAMLVATTAIAQPFYIPSGSMEPTLQIGDGLIATKYDYGYSRYSVPFAIGPSSQARLLQKAPARGDIVIFPNPGHDPTGRVQTLIKRVVAVGGDTVDIQDGKLVLNGNALNEPYVHGKPTLPVTVHMPLKIPAGYVFLMGDNRPNSGDARYFGPQPLSAIEGRAFAVYWPISEMHSL